MQGHLNPAVTVAIVAARKMTIVKGLLYMVAQILGSTCGAALVLAALPTEICVAINYGATYLAKNGKLFFQPHHPE